MIFAHRGLWSAEVAANSKVALEGANSHGFGVETDFRSQSGQLITAHEASDPANELKNLNIFDTPVALNIKEDGLQPLFTRWRETVIDSNSFFFDGSLPEMYKYYKTGLPHALRLSEFELELPWNSPVVWLDAFESDWWLDTDSFKRILSFPRVVAVSPELHGRDHRAVWDAVLEATANGQDNLSICTDYPEAFYKESNV